MNSLKQYIIEKFKLSSDNITKKDNSKLDKWKDKCKNLSLAGGFGYTSPKLTVMDFDGFVEDMDKYFEPEGEGRWLKECEARYEFCQMIRDGEIYKAQEFAKENINDPHISYGAHPQSKYVYGSYLLDCYAIFSLVEYIYKESKRNDIEVKRMIAGDVIYLDDDLSWLDNFSNNVDKKIKWYK